MKFNIDQYKGNYAMHCKTLEEAMFFLDYLRNLGRHWCNGERYAGTVTGTNFNSHGDATGYAFNEGRYGNIPWYTEHDYTVLTFEDFEWEGLDLPSPTTTDLKRFNNFFSQFVIT